MEVKGLLWALASPDSKTWQPPLTPAPNITWHRVSSLCFSASSVASRASFRSSSCVGGVVMSRKWVRAWLSEQGGSRLSLTQ